MINWTETLGTTKVIPVLVIDAVEDAIPLAETLRDAGLRILEITLRTPAAMSAMQAILESVSDVVVGAGTILEPNQIAELKGMGVAFGVSPGATPRLVDAALGYDFAYLPGTQTLSEMMALREQGITFQKFFPAELNGGPAVLKAASAVLHDVTFCPTGGVTPENAETYLALPNVRCVGGTWIAPLDLVNTKNWEEIGRRAKAASQLGQ